ncbi:MAG: hypothetical protein AAF962_26905 [Actinomycetota bacterium]
MTAWLRFLRWLRGSERDADRVAPEQVALVRPYEAPVLREVLDRNGIACEVVEQHSPATWEPMVAVLVSSADSARAVDVIKRFRAG